MIENKEIKSIKKAKKVWSKPKLFLGKEIGFMGLGRFQASSTGPYGTPS
jgi:hypothetical protein